MSRINSNVPSLIAQRHLTGSQRALSQSLERLSSGLQINRGKDDPAGLIVSERLRSEVSAVRQAIDNSSRAINVIATTEGALDESSALLRDIQALLVEAANKGAFSDEEIAANQLQIDNAIESITRIANTTTFAGRKLLNGELDYVTSGVNSSELTDINVLGASFGTQPYVPVTVEVAQSAQRAELLFTASSLTNGATIDLGGNDGIITLTFPASASTPDMAQVINANRDSTGVIAVLSGASGASGMRLQSIEYGSKSFVTVDEIPDNNAFQVQNASGASVRRDAGQDATATVNGISATADGLKLSFSSRLLRLEVNLDEQFGNGSTGLGSSTFAITEGGALFQLGPQVNTNLQENIGVKNIQANKLGNAIVGYLSDLKSGQQYALNQDKFQEASKVVEEAITQVAVVRGRLGAFERNTLQTNINQLQITAENLTASEAVIRDTDFAVETSELTRAQILVQAGNSVLAIANAQSQNVLTLLGG